MGSLEGIEEIVSHSDAYFGLNLFIFITIDILCDETCLVKVTIKKLFLII